MKIRHAKITDAHGISDLVNHYAEQDKMLHRSLESIYAGIRGFVVAEDDTGNLIGCVGMDVFWSDSAEIRSLAVAESVRGQDVGTNLIRQCIADAATLNLPKLFAMTYEKLFFQRLGFVEVDIKTLPEKVWRECLEWYGRGHRHETAMIYHIGEQ